MLKGVPQGLAYLGFAGLWGLWVFLLRPVIGLPLALLTSVLPSVPFYILQERHIRTKRRSRFEGRPAIGETEFFSVYYGESGIPREVACKVLNEVAAASGVPATQIRPTDRFDVEFAPVQGWEWDDDVQVELNSFLRYRMKTAGVRDIVPAYTVDDLIRRVSQLDALAKARRG